MRGNVQHLPKFKVKKSIFITSISAKSRNLGPLLVQKSITDNVLWAAHAHDATQLNLDSNNTMKVLL